MGIDERRYDTRDIENEGANKSFRGFPMRQMVGFDGQNLQQQTADNVAVKITVDGSITYVALAAPGTLQSAAKWQVRKINETSGVVITWCDGNANFDNVATDLTTLTYS